jgi:hypothetical protein
MMLKALDLIQARTHMAAPAQIFHAKFSSGVENLQLRA